MKKLMFGFAALAGILSAGAIESENVVGYETITDISAAQYVGLGVVFQSVNGGNIAVKDVVTVSDPVGSAAIGASDQIWRWDTASATWTKYFYYNSRGTTQWRKSGESAETTDTIPAGETFFFLRSSGATTTTTLTLAGQVVPFTGSTSFTTSAAQLAFASNPWPVAISIADFSSYYTSGSPVGSAAIGASDQIWIWETASAGWAKYYYYNSRGTTGWRKSGESSTTTDTIPAGTGFFFQRSSGATEAATISFTYSEK